MRRILNHNQSLEVRYIARKFGTQTILPKTHIKTTLQNKVGEVPCPQLKNAEMLTDESGPNVYKERYDELRLDNDINVSILEEQGIELDTLREELSETRRKLESESAQRMLLENEVCELKTEAARAAASPPPETTGISKEELENARREAHYYHCRMEQEKQLSRQLLTQIEEMKASRVPVVTPETPETPDATPDEEEKTERRVGESILSRACIVCTERHAYYEPMPCDHPICTECYVHWFASRMQYNDTRMEGEPPVIFGCPLCRTPIEI